MLVTGTPVITTNYLDKIDPALRRPGRMDWVVKFGHPSQEDHWDMFCHVYSDHAIPAHFQSSDILAESWTFADTMMVYRSNKDNPIRAFEIICSSKE